MKKFLIALAAVGLTLGGAAHAQLGGADSNRNVWIHAYCGTWGNDCKVYFKGTRMSVDGSSGIDGSQIRDWEIDCINCGKLWAGHYKFTLYYSDFGATKMAVFRFHEYKDANFFGQYVNSIRRP